MDDFETHLQALRPRLHRYCARMTGSTVDGEDVLQEALLKAVRARDQAEAVENLDGWLFRIAHNASLDFLRQRARTTLVPLAPDLAATPAPDPDVAAVGFRTFLRLPELQRCAVILKDVLGHSVDEIAAVAGCSPAAAKSALQRGRATLRQLAARPEGPMLPLISDGDRRRMTTFVQLFRDGDFDAIRALLARDVRLELVNRLRLDGKEKIAPYFTRYAETPTWRFALGAVEGRPAMLVFSATAMERPAHFVLLDWRGDRIAEIRDYLFAPYALDAADWLRLD